MRTNMHESEPCDHQACLSCTRSPSCLKALSLSGVGCASYANYWCRSELLFVAVDDLRPPGPRTHYLAPMDGDRTGVCVERRVKHTV